ncbi:MAG TPA: hypothetical protein VHU80_16990 [Polyangiaceae bacterium]|jgi:hypothetical protein|nr:hypothetical protein [Polyangiaceae bacterium]
MRVAVVLAALCCSCGSARIAGGAQVAPGSEPAGAVIALFNVTRCEDANGGRVPEPEARVSMVKMPDSRLVLVERRPGYDSLVVDNGWNEGTMRVFQLALKRSSSRPYVREYRLPVSGSGYGRMVITDRVRTWRDAEHGFRASYVTPSLSCDLAPT